MARPRSVKAIDSKIDKTQNKLSKAKARYDALCKELSVLMKEREAIQGQEILAALKNSGKTYREVMTFLGR